MAVLLAATVLASYGSATAQNRAVSVKPLGPSKADALPAALPGARSVPGAAERTVPQGAMAPNEALFDAVNRGDIGSAREALNRGANVEARNMLGLTSIELSVDLGRNDITFLLLSTRGSRAATVPAPGGTAKPASPTKVAAAIQAPAPAARPATPAPVRQAYGNDPGVPNPQAGFLGFAIRPN
ncbi:MAG: ankyrin repeat domain-containing protein [Alphaproteobacteria bacterium]|nr:ankyrin repeat domain-containing protein [Alphaproteobacteria bacterium]